jgi:tetratricopeptide (TPR) repeat protein
VKRFLLHIAVFLVVFSGVSQETQQREVFEIKGTVKGKENLEPIANVDIYVSGGRFTKTDMAGRFRIQARIGDEISFRSPEFETVYHTIRTKEDIDVRVEGYIKEQEKKAYSKKAPEVQHEQLLDSAAFYKKKDIDKSIGFIEQSLTLLNKRGDKRKTAQSYSVLADIYVYYKQYDLAITNYQTSLREGYDATTKLKLAKAYLLNKNYKDASTFFNELKGVRGLSTYQQIEVHEGLGDAQKRLQNLSEALTSYTKALEIAKNNLVTPKITDLNSKIAEVYAQQNNIQQAEKQFQNSLELAKKQNARRAVQEKQKVADFYNEKNLYDKEINIRQSLLQDVEALDKGKIVAVVEDAAEVAYDSITTQQTNYKIANAYIAKDQYKEAIPFLEKSIAEANKKEDLVVQKDATRKLSEVFKSTGDYTKALETYQDYVELVDKLYVKKEQELSQAARFSQDIALKQNRISSLEQERALSESRYDLAVTNQKLVQESNKRQQIAIYFLIFGMLLLAVTSWLFYRSNRQQKLNNNLLALKSLRTQMNPHFIFNALNSVNNFIAKNDERSANRYLSEFSTLMRAVLENSEEDFIPLQKEIELLKLYTKLEHSRFAEKFDYSIDVDSSIDVDAYQIPPMLLQPYVENAIWHGLRYKEEKGNLSISFQPSKENSIAIVIEDDGIGRKKSARLKTKNQQKQKSKGMGNIKKRIAILNNMYKDKVDVEVTDAYNDATGTKVILILKKD